MEKIFINVTKMKLKGKFKLKIANSRESLKRKPLGCLLWERASPNLRNLVVYIRGIT